jgi:hypothetical protein
MRAHETYFPTAQTFNPTNFVLLRLYLRKVNLHVQSSNKVPRSTRLVCFMFICRQIHLYFIDTTPRHICVAQNG